MPEFVIPDVPQMGVPAGMKQAGQRVDFRPDQFDLTIETKGYLCLWERATICPCSPVTSQTEQPDPNCELCGGKGWIYFGALSSQDISDYKLTDLQAELVSASGGMLIRGIITGITNREDNLDVISRRTEGMAALTVRSENKLGYYDKITTLDGEIAYSEILIADGTQILSTRYPVVAMNNLQSVSQSYKVGVDFGTEKGVLTWLPGREPASGVRLSAHYLCHPVWLVVEHPHSARITLRKFKTAVLASPTGTARQLPVQALIRYHFLQEP